MSFTLRPEARAVIEMFAKAQRNYRAKMAKIAEEAAKEMVETVQLSIASQSLGHTALSEKWVQTKARLGLDPRILMATGDYVRSFAVVKSPQGVTITCQKDKMKLLEYGTKYSPARPHWRPAVAAMKSGRFKSYKEAFNVLFSD